MASYRSTVCDQKLPKELPTWTDLSAGVDNVTETDNITICDLLQKYQTELCFYLEMQLSQCNPNTELNVFIYSVANKLCFMGLR